MATNQDQTLLFSPGRIAPLVANGRPRHGASVVPRDIRPRHLSISGTGEDTTGVYGFTNVFLRALQDWKPTYCAIAFDMSGPTFRHERFERVQGPTPVYAAGAEAAVRPGETTNDGVRRPYIPDGGLRGGRYHRTLARQAEAHGVDTVIIKGDRDTFQLISPKTRVDLFYSIQDRSTYDEPELEKRYSGLTAAQQPDFKALVR